VSLFACLVCSQGTISAQPLFVHVPKRYQRGEVVGSNGQHHTVDNDAAVPEESRDDDGPDGLRRQRLHQHAF